MTLTTSNLQDDQDKLGSSLLIQWLDYSKSPKDPSTKEPKYVDPLKAAYADPDDGGFDISEYITGATVEFKTHCMNGWDTGDIVKSFSKSTSPTNVPKNWGILANLSRDYINRSIHLNEFVAGCYDNESGANRHDVVASIQLMSKDKTTIGYPHKFSVKLFDRGPADNNCEIYDHFKLANETKADLKRQMGEKIQYVKSSFTVDFDYAPTKNNPTHDTFSFTYTCNFIIAYCGVIMSRSSPMDFQDSDNCNCPAVYVAFLNVADDLAPSNSTLVSLVAS